MRWPVHPIQNVRPSRFLPPFCPWPDCRAHRTRGRGFRRHGWYRTKTKSDPRKIPRFRCKDCGRTCGRSTFSTTYYLKRPELLPLVAAGLAACSAQRQIARSARCSKTTVTRLAERLGRHAILLQARWRRWVPTPPEPVVHDHFEAFIGRQDHALGIGTAVGARSWFLYDVDPAPHRGSGRRPDRRPDGTTPPKASYVRSIRRTLKTLVPRGPGEVLALRVDGRADYRAALRYRELRGRVALRVYPNPVRGPKGTPRSVEARIRDKAMFPVDALHQLLRHTCSDHKRETIAFGRRLESIVGRAHLMALWRNFLKGMSERKRDPTTPAMRLGLTDEPWTWSRVLTRRLFPARERPTESALRLYRKRWTDGPPLRRAHAG